VVDDNAIDFIGHTVALHRDNRYINEPAPALDTVKRMKVSVLFFHFKLNLVLRPLVY
jgi:GDP dissociation inhibitor